MDSMGNMHYATSVLGNWMYESNYEKALVIYRESLDIICSLSVG